MTEQGDQDERVKTVFAHFGLAMYLVQVLECGLANTMMCAKLLPQKAGKPVPKGEWEAEFNAFMSEHY